MWFKNFWVCAMGSVRPPVVFERIVIFELRDRVLSPCLGVACEFDVNCGSELSFFLVKFSLNKRHWFWLVYEWELFGNLAQWLGGGDTDCGCVCSNSTLAVVLTCPLSLQEFQFFSPCIFLIIRRALAHWKWIKSEDILNLWLSCKESSLQQKSQ